MTFLRTVKTFVSAIRRWRSGMAPLETVLLRELLDRAPEEISGMLGRQICAVNRVQRDVEHREEEFSLTKENNYRFEFTGQPVELIDYSINSENRGQRYGGYVIIVRDSLDKIVAHKASSENLFEIVDNLREIKPGWYFDKAGNRCLPTPPRPFAAPNNSN